MRSISLELTFCTNRRLEMTVAIGFIAFFVAIGGCSKSPYELAKVRGKVTLENQPLTAGKVMFAPVAKQDAMDAGKPAVGLIQPDGSFALTTLNDGDGAIVGEHWVTVFVPQNGVAAKAVESEEGNEPPQQFKRIAVPKKQVVVADQDNQINIQL